MRRVGRLIAPRAKKSSSSATGTASAVITCGLTAAANTAARRLTAASADSRSLSVLVASRFAWPLEPRLRILARRVVHEPGPRRHLVRRLFLGAAAHAGGVGPRGERGGHDPGRISPRLSHLALHRR